LNAEDLEFDWTKPAEVAAGAISIASAVTPSLLAPIDRWGKHEKSGVTRFLGTYESHDVGARGGNLDVVECKSRMGFCNEDSSVKRLMTY